jgi:hypothetical protein
MTIIKGTLLEQIGIRPIEAVMSDIWITRHRLAEKRCICAISPVGFSWVWMNMDITYMDRQPVIVDAESIQETISKMQRDGLTVEER